MFVWLFQQSHVIVFFYGSAKVRLIAGRAELSASLAL